MTQAAAQFGGVGLWEGRRYRSSPVRADLNGTVAVVTGAGRGIGRETMIISSCTVPMPGETVEVTIQEASWIVVGMMLYAEGVRRSQSFKSSDWKKKAANCRGELN